MDIKYWDRSVQLDGRCPLIIIYGYEEMGTNRIWDTGLVGQKRTGVSMSLKCGPRFPLPSIVLLMKSVM